MQNTDTSVALFGVSVGGGAAVISSVSCQCNVVRETLGFGNLFCGVSFIMSFLQTFGMPRGQATVVHACIIDDVLDARFLVFVVFKHLLVLAKAQWTSCSIWKWHGPFGLA